MYHVSGTAWHCTRATEVASKPQYSVSKATTFLSTSPVNLKLRILGCRRLRPSLTPAARSLHSIRLAASWPGESVIIRVLVVTSQTAEEFLLFSHASPGSGLSKAPFATLLASSSDVQSKESSSFMVPVLGVPAASLTLPGLSPLLSRL